MTKVSIPLQDLLRLYLEQGIDEVYLTHEGTSCVPFPRTIWQALLAEEAHSYHTHAPFFHNEEAHATENAPLTCKSAVIAASSVAQRTAKPIAPASSAPSEDKTVTTPAIYEELKEITTLNALYNYINAFTGCALKGAALNTVICDGCPKAPIMLIGEAPGADEDRLGKPFVGRSGQLLDKMLAAIDLDRNKTGDDSVYIANIVPWRPPGNRVPTNAEIDICRPLIERHISLVNPHLIVLVGSTAMRALLGLSQGITHVRGHLHTYTNPFLDKPIQALPTFHPAYLLRSASQKRHSWEDMKKVKAIKELYVQRGKR